MHEMQYYYLMSPRTLAPMAPLRDFRGVEAEASHLGRLEAIEVWKHAALAFPV
jgi:hypothetical protein